MMNLETRAPMHVTTLFIPEGDAGTVATIAAMRRLIDEGKKHPVVYELARDILRRARVRAFDRMGEAKAIYAAVLRNMRFTSDIRGKETLHSAAELVRLKMGDCDDYTVLMCSLLESVGLGTQIKTIANDEREPETFTHVYPEVFIDGRWVTVDGARRKPAFGKAPAYSFRTRVWATGSPEYQDIAGLAGLGAYVPGPAANLTRLRPWNPRMPAALRNALGAYPQRRPPAYAPRGQGNYGLRAMRALHLGDDTDQDVSTLINSSEVGAANIISALRANPNNLSPTTAPGSYGTNSLTTAAGTMNWTPILLIGGVGLVIAVFAMRGEGGRR